MGSIERKGCGRLLRRLLFTLWMLSLSLVLACVVVALLQGLAPSQGKGEKREGGVQWGRSIDRKGCGPLLRRLLFPLCDTPSPRQRIRVGIDDDAEASFLAPARHADKEWDR